MRPPDVCEAFNLVATSKLFLTLEKNSWRAFDIVALADSRVVTFLKGTDKVLESFQVERLFYDEQGRG